MKLNFGILLGCLLLLTLPGIANGQTEEIRHKEFNLKKGVAIDGYDPVSYFSGSPKKGDERTSYTYKNVVYQFSSDANLEKFKSAPEKYEPQYGGWCAYAIGKSGEKVKIDPLTYKITDGKLYLFYNFRGYNTLDDWNRDEASLMATADKNWQLLFDR